MRRARGRVTDTGNAYSGALGIGAESVGTAWNDGGAFARADLTIITDAALTLELHERDADTDAWITVESWPVAASASPQPLPFPRSKKQFRRKLIGGLAPAAVTLAVVHDPRPVDHNAVLERQAFALLAGANSLRVIPLGARGWTWGGYRDADAAQQASCCWRISNNLNTIWGPTKQSGSGGNNNTGTLCPLGDMLTNGNRPTHIFVAEAVGQASHCWICFFP